MTVDDCNPLTLTADNKIPDDYLAAERTWIAQNKPPFSQIYPFGYATEIRYLTDYHFPLPVYPIFAPGQGYGQPGPEQWMTSCAALPDGTIVFSAIVRPSYMPDMLNVRSDNIPVLHFAYPQASHDWVMEHTDLFYQLEGARGPVASPSEVLEMINSADQMAGLKNMSFWVVAPSSTAYDLTVLPPALEPLSRFIALNNNYDSNHPFITGQWPGFVDVAGDLVMFMSYGNVDGLPLSGRLSDIVLPVLGISFAY
ncbi:MAG: hypothetical protein FJ010_06160 [Chloroflexi bacterium]|nr:hypothetical protein [Chloroflexota bacterium]